MFNTKKAIRNPLTREPILAKRGSGLNATGQPRANVRGVVRNPLQRQPKGR